MRALAGIFLAIFLLPAQASAATLEIENQSDQEIINILASNPAREFFLRLDLLPHASDSIENPDCEATLRADTGLEFWNFPQIDLAKARRLVFCGEHPACIVIEGDKSVHYEAKVTPLVPQKGDRPVCNLDQFRPAMSMAEVCEILPGEMPRDDNGALLAGIGFAGLTWAARLIPDSTKPLSDASPLDHLALRRPLDLSAFDQLLAALYKQGYVPWQAEFPGIEMNLGAEPASRSEAEVAALAKGFLDFFKSAGHADHAKGERCAEASVIMAPKARLAELANSDEPASDLLIYTIYLQPCAHTLLLDLASYRGES